MEEEQIDGSSERPSQHFFDNLLPEESARILLAEELDDYFIGYVTPKKKYGPLNVYVLNGHIKNSPKSPEKIKRLNECHLLVLNIKYW
ncbi:hypothetical protein AADZ91_06615 [Colwelliaceae bacterium 6441]